MTEDKRPTLSLKRKPGEKTPESGADTARVVRRKPPAVNRRFGDLQPDQDIAVNYSLA